MLKDKPLPTTFQQLICSLVKLAPDHEVDRYGMALDEYDYQHYTDHQEQVEWDISPEIKIEFWIEVRCSHYLEQDPPMHSISLESYNVRDTITVWIGEDSYTFKPNRILTDVINQKITE